MDNRFHKSPRPLATGSFPWARAAIAIGVVLVLLYFVVQPNFRGIDDSTKQEETAIEDTTTLPVTVADVFQENVFARVANIYPDVMTIFDDREGGLVVVSKYDVTKFSLGALDNPFRMLDGPFFRKYLSASLPSLSTGALGISGEIWLGSWQGHLIRGYGTRWEMISEPENPVRGKVAAIARLNNEMYIGGAHLWLWNEVGKQLLEVSSYEGGPVTALAVSANDELFVGGHRGLWILDQGEWSLLWPLPSENGSIRTLFVPSPEVIFIGTNDGLVKISRSGQTLLRTLAGSKVQSIATTEEGDIWVGVWGEGLRLIEENMMYQGDSTDGLPDDDVISLYIDNNKKLWCGLYGKGLYVAALEQAKVWIKE